MVPSTAVVVLTLSQKSHPTDGPSFHPTEFPSISLTIFAITVKTVEPIANPSIVPTTVTTIINPTVYYPTKHPSFSLSLHPTSCPTVAASYLLFLFHLKVSVQISFRSTYNTSYYGISNYVTIPNTHHCLGVPSLLSFGYPSAVPVVPSSPPT